MEHQPPCSRGKTEMTVRGEARQLPQHQAATLTPPVEEPKEPRYLRGTSPGSLTLWLHPASDTELSYNLGFCLLP